MWEILFQFSGLNTFLLLKVTGSYTCQQLLEPFPSVLFLTVYYTRCRYITKIAWLCWKPFQWLFRFSKRWFHRETYSHWCQWSFLKQALEKEHNTWARERFVKNYRAYSKKENCAKMEHYTTLETITPRFFTVYAVSTRTMSIPFIMNTHICFYWRRDSIIRKSTEHWQSRHSNSRNRIVHDKEVSEFLLSIIPIGKNTWWYLKK